MPVLLFQSFLYCVCSAGTAEHQRPVEGHKLILKFTQVLASLVAQRVKNTLAMQETQVQSLSWKDPLEKGMATHSSILAWRTPWTEEP